MKKLLIAAVALASGVASAGIVSSSIVGYQNRDIDSDGWQLITSTFLPIGKEKSEAKLSDITPTGWSFWGGDYVQFLDASGGTKTFVVGEEEYPCLFTYLTTADGAPADGWYQYEQAMAFNFIPAPNADTALEYGDGAVYAATSGSAKLVYSGEVAQTPQSIMVDRVGWNIIGNPTPVETTFSDITPDGWNFWAGDYLQFLDASGGTKTFVYQDQEYPCMFTYLTTADGAPAAGWYQYEQAMAFNFISIQDAGLNDVASGQAFVFATESRTATVQFPGAL